MIKTCSIKGFSIKFENGNTVSVQWGPQNYCDPTHPEGRDADSREPMRAESWASETAEVAAWDSDGNWHHFGYDSVEGWRTGDQIAEFINFVANNKLATKSETTPDPIYSYTEEFIPGPVMTAPRCDNSVE